jgi:hypothetical protein
MNDRNKLIHQSINVSKLFEIYILYTDMTINVRQHFVYLFTNKQ